MSRKGENIYKRADGRWEARYIMGYEELTGKAKYAYLYDYSYNEVKAKRAIMQSKVCEKHSKFKTVEQTFKEWIGLKSEDPRIHRSTISQYKMHIDNHINPVMGKARLHFLTAKALEQFKNNKLSCGRLDGRGGLSCTVVDTIMQLIFGMLEYAKEEGYVCAVPMRKPKKSAGNKKQECRVLSVQEQAILEDALCRRVKGVDSDGLYIGILFSLYTGLRVGELGGLQWQDMDFHKGCMTIRRTLQRLKALQNSGAKTYLHLGPPKSASSERKIPLKIELAHMLKNYYNGLPENMCGPEAFIFARSVNPIEPRTFQFQFKKILKEAGVADANFHCLRHTFATRCIEKNVDIQTLSEYLGHSNGNVTLKFYAHSFMEHKEDCINRLNFLGSSPELKSISRQVS